MISDMGNRQNKEESINKDKFDDNLVNSVINYAERTIGLTLDVDGKSLKINYLKKDPKLTQDVEAQIPCLIFKILDTKHGAEYHKSMIKIVGTKHGVDHFKQVMEGSHSSLCIWGYGGASKYDSLLNEKILDKIMVLVEKYFNEIDTIEFRESTGLKGALKVNIQIKK